jgi:hypothetical protein
MMADDNVKEKKRREWNGREGKGTGRKEGREGGKQERRKERENERKNERKNERTNERTNERKNERENERRKEREKERQKRNRGDQMKSCERELRAIESMKDGRSKSSWRIISHHMIQRIEGYICRSESLNCEIVQLKI